MSLAHRLAEKIRRGERLPLPIALALHAATPAQRLGMWLRHRSPATRVEARVISFGNLTTGGTGKTPAVIARAQAEIAAGRKVALLTRGYGAPRTHRLIAARGADVGFEDFGDEPVLVARRVGPELSVVRAADRVAGARHAIAEYGCDTLLLDDGFQTVQLARDEDIVLIDATNPFGSGHLVPRGILREPKSALRRATQFMLTRCDQVADTEALEMELRAWSKQTPIVRTRHRPERLYGVAGDQPLTWLRGQFVNAVCAIGNPESFRQTIERLGASVVRLSHYPDHAAIPDSAFGGDLPILCTEKDYVRLQPPRPNVWALAVALEVIG